MNDFNKKPYATKHKDLWKAINYFHISILTLSTVAISRE